MKRPRRERPITRPRIESLETRRLLALFGNPWPEARSLTVSYPADGTPIGERPSELREMLDAVADRQQWQEVSLRAFQTWAYHADINVGLRPDHGLPFGAPGLSVGDPRFGDFRIGAIPQTGVLANALPFQINAGTFSGDILLNSSIGYTFHDWDDGTPPGPESPAGFDLFSVLLHETGNALGLDDNRDAGSVMFANYTEPKGTLTQPDIDAIRSLYGARSDPFESAGNGTLRAATLVPVPLGFDPDSETLDVDGTLAGGDDVDVYRFSLRGGRDEARVTLHAAGLSLLQANVEVLDVDGKVLVSGASRSVFENDVVLDLQGLAAHDVLFARISPKDGGVYSVGDYRLRFDPRAPATRASDPAPGHHEAGIESLWKHFAPADGEYGDDETAGDAADMPAAAGIDTRTRFQTHASLRRPDTDLPTDVDVWKVTSPASFSGPMAVHVSPVGANGVDLRVRILDVNGEPVGASGYLRPDGTWTLELAQPAASTDYFIRVSVDPGSIVDVGNYVASAEFAPADDQMHLMVSRTVSSSVDDFVRWQAGKTKLYRFDLSAGGQVGDEWVQVTVYDAHTQAIRMTLSTPAGGLRSAYAMLDQGDYLLRFTAVSRSGNDVDAIDLQLMVDGLSDDQDPNDPNDDDYYYDPYDEAYEYDYYYPPDDYDYEEFPSDPGYDYYYYYYYDDDGGDDDFEEPYPDGEGE